MNISKIESSISYLEFLWFQFDLYIDIFHPNIPNTPFQGAPST